MDKEKRYDVIVIGAGFSGLTAAFEQAKAGKTVLVLDRNNVPGGRAVSFRRGCFEFETRSSGDLEGSAEKAETRPSVRALALESQLRDLGVEFWYKTTAIHINDNEKERGVFLSTGDFIPSGQIIANSMPAEDTFTVFLGLDIDAELSAPDADFSGCDMVPRSLTDGNSVIRLERAGLRDAFKNVSVSDYFKLKDQIIGSIVDEAEKTYKTDIRHHIVEIDASSPLTEARYSGPLSGFEPGTAAYSLHPSVQFAKIMRVIDRGHAKSFVIGPDPARGTKSLAYFRAGQYISILQQIGENRVCKPYSICASPKDALDSTDPSYTVMIERNPEGFFSPHALDTWEEGTPLILSGPIGNFYHQPLRDAPHVVALAGSSGVTPFFSMAAAIADGIEDFDLTILYGSNTEKQILLKEELDEIVRRASGKVRVIHVLADEKKDGYESGFITPDLIRKYAPAADYSILICGPQAMYTYLRRELPGLGLPSRRIRFELPGEFGDPALDPEYPKGAGGKVWQVTVRERGKEKTLLCRSDQTLLQAIERSGSVMEADCRSGQCGWCRSRLLSGEVFVPKSRDGRRAGDAGSSWVHPCVTYPLSDVVIETANH